MAISVGVPARLDWPGRVAEAWSWLPEAEIESETLSQVHAIGSLAPAVRVAVMPDAHKGYGMPIGSMLATDGTVVPYAVGVDIGCGMIAARTSLRAHEVPAGAVQRACEGIYRRVPVGLPSRGDPKQGGHSTRQNSAVLREWYDERGDAHVESSRIRERAVRELDVTERIETVHNFAALERHDGRDLVVHRKGAVRTATPDGPLLVTIPR